MTSKAGDVQSTDFTSETAEQEPSKKYDAISTPKTNISEDTQSLILTHTEDHIKDGNCFYRSNYSVTILLSILFRIQLVVFFVEEIEYTKKIVCLLSLLSVNL